MSYIDIDLYLGSFISMEKISTQVKHHFSDKYRHVVKFYMFLYKNNDVPYHLKQSIWDSAIKSTLFYGAETWLTRDLAVAESTYLATVKRMLGVRSSTTTDLVLIEAGIPPPKAYVQQKQHLFIHKLTARDGFWESYIGKAVSLSLQHKTEAGRLIKFYMNTPPEHDFLSHSMEQVKRSVQTSISTSAMKFRLKSMYY